MAGEEPGKLNNFNLTDIGVNVDVVQVQKEDGSFTKAQNAVADNLGNAKAIRKRPGFVKFNSGAGSGAILGGVGVPLSLTTTSVGGVTLNSGPTRKTFWGRRSKSSAIGATQGWSTSIDGFASAVGVIVGATPSNPRASAIADGWESTFWTANNGMPNSAGVIGNQLIYPSDNYTPGTDGIPIYTFDGTTDLKLLDIPKSAAAPYGAVVSMLVVGATVYISVYDDDNAVGATRGRVFALDPSSGVLTQVGADFVGVVPYALAWHAGRLWVGVVDNSSAGGVYFFRPSIDTAWTLDRTIGSGNCCTGLISYNGELFAFGRGNPAPADKRSSIGAWTSSTTFGSANCEVTSAVVFNGSLYVAYTPTVTLLTVIMKYNGSAWSTVYTALSGMVFPAAWVDNGVVYFGGGGHNVAATLLSSPDGTSWTDRSSNLSGSSFANLACVGTLVL